MIFLFIIIAFCMIFAIQLSIQKGANIQRDPRTDSRQRREDPPVRHTKERHNPLFGPFRGTLDEDHVDIVGDTVIKHEEAEAGYVILNGVKRRIEDCKDL